MGLSMADSVYYLLCLKSLLSRATQMPTQLTEQAEDVHKALERYRKEIVETADVYYTWKSLHDKLAIDPDAYRGFNRNSYFWGLIIQSLQQSYFISAGRIFDTTKGTFTLPKLESVILKNAGVFQTRTASVPERMGLRSGEETGRCSTGCAIPSLQLDKRQHERRAKR